MRRFNDLGTRTRLVGAFLAVAIIIVGVAFVGHIRGLTMSILVAYATRHGATRGIADAIHPREEKVFFGAIDPAAKPIGFVERFVSLMPAAKAAFPKGRLPRLAVDRRMGGRDRARARGGGRPRVLSRDPGAGETLTRGRVWLLPEEMGLNANGSRSTLMSSCRTSTRASALA